MEMFEDLKSQRSNLTTPLIQSKMQTNNTKNRKRYDRSGKSTKTKRNRAKEREQMSVYFVIMFLIVFFVIIFTEILLMDNKPGTVWAKAKEYGEEDGGNYWGEDGIFFDEKGRLPKEKEEDLQRERLRYGRARNIQAQWMEDSYMEDKRNNRTNDNVDIKLLRMGVDENTEEFKNKILRVIKSKGSVGEWFPVKGIKHKFYVYSAYYDNRRSRFIRIIGVTKTKGSERVLCRLYYNNTERVVAGLIKVIRENWNLAYSACFILCPLYVIPQVSDIPLSVSVVKSPTEPPSNKMIVHINNKYAKKKQGNGTGSINKTNAKDDISLCVKPLHFHYNQVVNIIEFIELNSLLGVQHFTFYNDTIGKEVACVLNQYRKENLVSVWPWKLNMVSQKEIRTEGLFAALNDCLYRNMYKYKYVVMIDLDEYIMPHINNTLPQMLKMLHSKMKAGTLGAYSFQNAFFYLQWPDDSSTSNIPNLITLKKSRRNKKIHPHKQRSKYIAIPEYVTEAGNHFIWEYIPGRGTLNVPPKVGLLHHYRKCEFGGDDCIHNRWIVDRTAFKYKDSLLPRVRTRFQFLKAQCNLTDFNGYL